MYGVIYSDIIGRSYVLHGCACRLTRIFNNGFVCQCTIRHCLALDKVMRTHRRINMNTLAKTNFASGNCRQATECDRTYLVSGDKATLERYRQCVVGSSLVVGNHLVCQVFHLKGEYVSVGSNRSSIGDHATALRPHISLDRLLRQTVHNGRNGTSGSGLVGLGVRGRTYRCGTNYRSYYHRLRGQQRGRLYLWHLSCQTRMVIVGFTRTPLLLNFMVDNLGCTCKNRVLIRS